MANTNERILILGGSGFLSGTLARRAVESGHRVWTVTRGRRSPLPGVIPLTADRQDSAALAQALAEAHTEWDLVVDCIAYDPADVRQDIELLRPRARHLVVVSTDFVYDPSQRHLPQAEEPAAYTALGYGGKKRLAEQELFQGETGAMQWSVVRPCHIYGPGSQLGCLPLHGRDPQLIRRLRDGEPLKLVGGGYFLQQPVLARDLADTILSLSGSAAAYGQIFNVSGPDTVESRTYYQIIADILGVNFAVEEIPVAQALAERPESAPFFCHRIYDLSKLRAGGAAVPGTPLTQGLAEHVASLLEP